MNRLICSLCEQAAYALVLGSVADLQPGDRLVLGKRAWTYVGRSGDYPEYAHEQNEFLFAADHSSPGACGTRRVHSGSELESLIRAGFVTRMVPATLDLPRHVEEVVLIQPTQERHMGYQRVFTVTLKRGSVLSIVSPPEDINRALCDGPNFKKLVELIDDYGALHDDFEPYDFTEDLFSPDDAKLVRAMPNKVLCDDYDPLGGDTVEGALLGLMTDNGVERLKHVFEVYKAAYELAQEMRL